MLREYDRKLVLEDGSEFYGYAFGSDDDKVCELVFNTSPVGYQELISDPSYSRQAVVTAYPLIGNYGTALDDYESTNPQISALVVREYNDRPSNFRSVETLDSVMKRYRVAGISGLDTRFLIRSIRDYGTRKALITSAFTSKEDALKKLANESIPKDLVARASRKSSVTAFAKTTRFHVVAIDCGMKTNIARSLTARGCSLTIVPWNAQPDYIRSLSPDGVFISNGPGDPTDVPETIQTVRALLGELPIFGICLGHQIVSLAYGAKTYKLKFGHRGSNHSVRNLETKRIEITSQNHSYAVAPESLSETPLVVTHVNLLDGTIEGVRCARDRVFSVQYHPEGAPGPNDGAYLFEQFIAAMEREKTNA